MYRFHSVCLVCLDSTLILLQVPIRDRFGFLPTTVTALFCFETSRDQSKESRGLNCSRPLVSERCICLLPFLKAEEPTESRFST